MKLVVNIGDKIFENIYTTKKFAEKLRRELSTQCVSGSFNVDGTEVEWFIDNNMKLKQKVDNKSDVEKKIEKDLNKKSRVKNQPSMAYEMDIPNDI